MHSVLTKINTEKPYSHLCSDERSVGLEEMRVGPKYP